MTLKDIFQQARLLIAEGTNFICWAIDDIEQANPDEDPALFEQARDIILAGLVGKSGIQYGAFGGWLLSEFGASANFDIQLARMAWLDKLIEEHS